MTVSTLENVLWAAGFAGHAALLAILLIRKRARDFPVFTALVAYQAAISAVLFVVYRYGSNSLSTVTYWTSVLIDFAFQVALIFEIARIVLRPTGSWVRDARRSFLGLGAAGAVVAIALSFAVHPPSHNSLETWELRGNLFTSLLTCELFLAMMMTATRLGLAWRNHVMRLAQGLTAWAIVAVTIDTANSVLGWNRASPILEHVRMFTYLAALGYWITSFWLDEPERAPISADMQQYLVALHARVQYDLERVKRSGSSV